jgi:caa(3)-type oxidase subunit IV
MSNHGQNHSQQGHTTHHHILPFKMIATIGACLMVLTVITVWVAGIDLGRLNFVVAMAVASTKALLVALFFMNLKYDRAENGVIFGTSFVFLAIFIMLTSVDLFFRGDVYVKPGDLTASAASAKSKLKDPWIGTPELISHGKELFQTNCISCHGPEGKGNGPAAAALNPPPRNFTADAGWKNGRTVPMVFKTLKEGIPGSSMASFATLPADDRWALVHFVLSLGPSKVATPSAADLAKVGVSATGEAEKEAPTIPVEFAIERISAEAVQR